MIEIRRDYGEGGAGVLATKSAQHDRIADVLRGLVDNDVARTPATIANNDATDLPEALLLVNEIKGALNAASAAALEVTKSAH